MMASPFNVLVNNHRIIIPNVTCPVEVLFEEVAKKMNVSEEEFLLIFEGICLQRGAGKTLQDYNVKENSQLLYNPQQGDNGYIFVRDVDGVIHYISSLNPHTTIEELKLEIMKRTDMPSLQQRIIYAGKQLEDDRTLRDYNIGLQGGTTLDLLYRLRGS